MTKSDALRIFQTQAALGRAIGVSRSRVSQLPEELPFQIVDRVLGAALRLGKPIPRELVMDTSHQPPAEPMSRS